MSRRLRSQFVPIALTISVWNPILILSPRVRIAVQIIDREIQNPPSVSALAERLHLSRSRFQHLFKRDAGQGVTRFIRATRLSKANDLLRDPTRRIKEVAAAVGYPDSSRFSRDYRKAFGEPPTRFRQVASDVLW